MSEPEHISGPIQSFWEELKRRQERPLKPKKKTRTILNGHPIKADDEFWTDTSDLREPGEGE